MNVATCAIAAMSENRVIGREGQLPWHLPEDLKRFKALTLGKPVIMGRKTFDGIGRPLPGRTNFVLSRRDLRIYHKAHEDGSPGRTQRLAPPHPLQEAIHLAKLTARQDGVAEIMVVGGGEIYQQTMALIDRVYLTIVHQTIEGDAYFPALPPAQWRETAREARDGFSFVTYDRSG